MTTHTTRHIRNGLLTGITAAALLAAPQLFGPLTVGVVDLGVTAYAQGHGGGRGGGRGGQGYRGGRGAINQGTPGHHDEGEEGHDEEGHSGGHAGGSGHDNSSHGGGTSEGAGRSSGIRGAAGSGGSRGGKPVWAREGIPEVELGRLNVVRSPSRVIDHALADAVSSFNPAASAKLYSMTADEFASYVAANWDSVTIVDSPLQNLGLFREVMTSGTTQLSGVTPASKDDIAAIFLGTASDKTIPVTRDTVKAVTTIMNLPVTDAEIADIATKAEKVREGILTGHGE